MKQPEALFHYTVGPKLPLILESRQLMPTGFGLAASGREKPVLWWSENPQWEPTATKVISLDQGKTFMRPSLEVLQESASIYRFRLDLKNPEALLNLGIKLLPWVRVQTSARIAPSDVQKMVATGLRLGSTPTHWWGCLEPVPVSLEVSGVLRVEHRDPRAEGIHRDQWVPVEGGLVEAVAGFRRWAEAMGLRVKQTTASATPAARGV